MGWFRKSTDVASRTDAVASWGERAAKLVLWVVGPSVLSALAVGAYAWITANPLYGVIFGLVAFAIVQVALMLREIRRSAARRGPFAEPVPERAVSPASSSTDTEDVGRLEAQLAEKNQRIDELEQQLAANRPPRHHDIPASRVDDITPDKAREIEEEKQTLNAKIEELEAKLAEAEQEIERLRIEINNRPPRHFNTPVEVIETLTPAKAQEIEQLKSENEQLRNQVASPDVAKQKRLCLHLADDLRALYESFQQDERVLLAQRQKQKSAGATKEELEEERRTKQAEIEKRVVHKYHYGYPDRLEKLYEELEFRSWLGPNDEDLFLNVTIPLDILRVADRLRDVGGKL